MSNKLVSAIIVTHNRKELLVKAIRSVQKQTYPNIELIVVDDASDDGTMELLTELSQKQGFQYIRISKEESKGGNYARNTGIRASKGEYIALLDDDDEWLPEKISKQAQFLDENSDYGVVTCLRIFEYEMKRRVKVDTSNKPVGDLHAKILYHFSFYTSDFMAQRELLFEVGLFDEDLKIWQDYELSIRICQKAKVARLSEYLVLYRVITSDKARLTNNVDAWKNAVTYINKKHKKLIMALSDEEKKERELLIAKDGALRSNNIGNKRLQKKYLKKVAELKPTFTNKFKACLNIYKLSFWK